MDKTFKMPESVKVTLINNGDGFSSTEVDIQGPHTDNGAMAVLMMALSGMRKKSDFDKQVILEQFREVICNDIET